MMKFRTCCCALLLTTSSLLLLEPSHGISPNPAESYAAHPFDTNDGGQKHTRHVETMEAQAGVNANEDDPTEETLEGYTMVWNSQKARYEYADVQDGDLVPSGVAVVRGDVPPKGRFMLHQKRTLTGRQKVAKTSNGRRRTLQELQLPFSKVSHISEYPIWNDQVEDYHRRLQIKLDSVMDLKVLEAANPVQLKTLVIPMFFANHQSRWKPSQQQLTTLFNTQDAQISPTGSVKDVFATASHGKLQLQATVLDWIPLSKNETFYASNNRGYSATNMHQAMKEALDYLESQNFDFAQYDANQDGLIDSICFLHSGFAAEFMGVSEDGAYFMNRIWSHKWSLFTLGGGQGWTSTKTNVKIYNYVLTSSMYGTSLKTNQIARIGVLAHELGHFLGLVDLNDVNDRAHGIGNWGLMGNAWGFDNTQRCAPLMNPWSQLQLGWIAPTEITRADSGALLEMQPSYSADATYFIVKEGFPANEYLLLEYRKRSDTSEYCLPSEGGLAVWHIDDAAASFDVQGYPTEKNTTYPTNGHHYRVAMVQADGAFDMEQGFNQGDAADLFIGEGALWGPGKMTSLAMGGTSVVFPNTDSYQGGNVYSTGLTLMDVLPNTSAGTLELKINYADETLAPTVSHSPTTSPAPMANPTPEPTLNPTNFPTFSLEPTSTPSFMPSTTPAPTQPVETSCPDPGERLFKLEIDTGIFGSDVSWELTDALRGPELLKSDGPFQYATKRTYGVCLQHASCYSFIWKDDNQDGGATYKATYNGKTVIESSPATSSAPYPAKMGGDFGNNCAPGSSSDVHHMGQSGTMPVDQVMFDITAKQSLHLRRIPGLHLTDSPDGQPVNFQIFTREGSYRGYENTRDGWTRIYNHSNLWPSGPNQFTTGLWVFDTPVPMMKDTTQAFYFVFDKKVLMISNLPDTTLPGDVYSTQSGVWDFSVGTRTKSEFGGVLPDKPLVGVDGRYQVLYLDTLPNATPFPTKSPTKSPSSKPSARPSASPSAKPTIYRTPAPTKPKRDCPEGKELLIVEVETDDFGSENSWKLTDVFGANKVIQSKGPYTNERKYYRYQYCLQESSCYKWVISDSGGDGMQGANGSGYRIQWKNKVQADTMSAGMLRTSFSNDGVDFGAGCKADSRISAFTVSRANSNKMAGIMFDMTAKQDLVITKFVGLELGGGKNVAVKIYTRNGSYQGFETDPTAWNLVYDGVHWGQGQNTWTFLDNLKDIVILSGTRQAVYIETDPPELFNKIVWASQKDSVSTTVNGGMLQFRTGSPALANFGGTVPNQGAEVGGRIWLDTLLVSSSRSPTSSPTSSVRTNAPTKRPTKSPTDSPTKTPTESPTFSPTKFPTETPTITPTETPTITPTETPTKVPTSSPTENPTMTPTDGPTESPTLGPTESPTQTPTKSPVTSAPTTSQLDCSEGQELLIVEVETDDYGSDNSWELTDVYRGNTVRQSAGPYTDERKYYRYQYCLREDSCYKWVISDSAGDGMHGASGTGFRVQWKGKVETDTMNAGMLRSSFSQDGVGFGSMCRPGSQVGSYTINRANSDVMGGIMVDLLPGRDLVMERIVGFEFVGGTNYQVKIYTKAGSFHGFESDESAWTLVHSQTVSGNGYGSWSWLGNLDKPVPLLAGTRQALYVQLDPPGMINKLMDVSKMDSVASSLWSNLDITVGVPIQDTAFGGAVPGQAALLGGRIALDAIQILNTDAPTPGPTPAPTGTPTAAPTKMPTATPSAAPTKFRTPAPTKVLKECPAGQGLLIVEVETDDFGSENSWKLTNLSSGNAVVQSKGPYTNERRYYRYQYCLPETSCYKWVITDSAGDGMQGANGSGFRVQWKGQVETDTMSAGTLKTSFSQDGIDFGNCVSGSSISIYTINRAASDKMAGIMFDLTAKQDVALTRLVGIETQNKGVSYTVRIYSKNGSYKGSETNRDAWTWIHTQTVSGNGPNTWTFLNALNKDIVILGGTRQAIYIEVTPPEMLNKLVSLSSEGSVDSSMGGNLELRVGVPAKAGFGGTLPGQAAMLAGRIAISTAKAA